MLDIHVPEATKLHSRIAADDISFVDYSENGSIGKNRVIFNCYAVSFVLNGQKEIYRSTQKTLIKAGEAVIIPEGNSIIAERTLNTDKYRSLIVFFPAKLAINFLNKHSIIKTPAVTKADFPVEFLKFVQTKYLRQYIESLQVLIQQQQKVSFALALNKLEELLLVLLEAYPCQMIALFKNNNPNDTYSLRKLVENNLFNNLTLSEFAFLAHKSLASFKRDFEKTYGISPGKYIRERKLEIASAELLQGKKATEIYPDFGYDNLSNFSSAFKKKFGVTPKEYCLKREVS